MKHGQKLIGELGELAPEAGLLPHAQPADLRRRHAGAQVGLDRRLHARTPTASPIYDWTIVDRIFDTYLERGVQAVRADRLHAEGAVASSPSRTSTSGRPRRSTTRSTPAGPIRRRTTRSGRELVYQWAKHCVERYGRAEVETWYWEIWNEPNIGYWRGTPEEFRKLHDYAIDGVRRALPTARVGGPDTAGGGGRFTARLPRALPARHELRHRRDRHAARLRLVPRQGRAAVRRRPRADGHRQPAAHDRRRLPHRRLVSRAEGQADRHRRIRPRRLRRLPGTAARLSQRHDVLQLHGRQLRPQARPGRAARREPRRRADLGVRVRGPAVFRRLPLAGDQRHRQAGAQRVPHVQQDERPSGSPRERSRRAARRDAQARASASGPTSPRWPASTTLRASWSGTTTTTTCPARRPRWGWLSRASGRRGCAKLQHFRIDGEHSNAYTAWQRMGSPQPPSSAQYAELGKASASRPTLKSPVAVDIADGRATMRFMLLTPRRIPSRAGMVTSGIPLATR